MDSKETKPESDNHASPGFLSVVLSTLAAAIGVQSGRNQARDFSHGKVGHYIAAGLIFTVIFIVSLVVIVKAVLKNSGL